MIKTKIYVGSNNETGELEIVKIKDILRTAMQGYTLTLGNYNTGIIPELKLQLKQDSILVITSIVDANFND